MSKGLKVVYDGARGQSLMGLKLDVSHYEGQVRKMCGRRCFCRHSSIDDRGNPLRENLNGLDVLDVIHPAVDDAWLDAETPTACASFWARADEVFVVRSREARRRGYMRTSDVPEDERWW